MRTLLYGMPSSGASYVAWTMAQQCGTIGLLDMCHGDIPAPSDFPSGHDVVVKDTAGGLKRRLYRKWLARYKPDRIVIVVRDELAVRESLRRRHAESKVPSRFLRNGMVTADAMFAELNTAIKLQAHDEVIEYEQHVAEKHEISRRLLQVAVENHLYCKWCRPNSRPNRWGFGGIHYNKTAEPLVWHAVRYYGIVLNGSSRFRRVFRNAGLYVPPKGL